jgi:penicillin-binding protein 4
VRILTGYILTILLIPAFITIVTLTFNEAGKAESFNDILDEKVNLTQTKLSQTSLVLAGNGEVVTELNRPMNRRYVSSNEIPDFIKALFIVSEDQHFYQHPGFDLPAIGRALAINIHSDGIEQGASTITQQLARNQYLNHYQSYNRKLSEVLYAYQLEKTFSKTEILEQYLNAIYFQNNAYGIHAAADFYFKKKPADLSKAEQAFLAAIPNNPSFYDPLKHFDRTKKRQELLLDQLVQSGQLHFDEAEKLKTEEIVLKNRPRKNSYPDYTSFVLSELRELVSEHEKLESDQEINKRVDELLSSGVSIHTGLEPELQKRAKKSVAEHLPYKGIEGAAVVVNHESNLVVALAGGKNYQTGDFNRAYQAFRQPGSSIKPLLVYAPYFERTEASITEKVDAGAICIKGYCPKNYGGAIYGKVSLEQAFTHSYNTPAIRLFLQVGVDEAFNDLSPFHFEQVTDRDRVPASAVGGFTTGMSPLELTEAYTVFSNEGRFTKPRAIVKVTDRNGKLLFKWNEKLVKIWSPKTAATVNDLMIKTVSSGTARKAAIAGQRAGGKTGTTNDFKDLWFIGFSGELTAGVWVGKDTPESMESIHAKSPQLLIWRDIMK